MRSFTAYCAILSMVGIVMNLLFILVTRIQRVERVQEVLIFMRSISVGYILVALALMAVAPQSITLASTNIRIPHGLLALSNAGLTSNFMNGLAAFGAGCFLFTAFCFCLLFLYHYRKTAGQMSTVFAPKNVPVFLGVAIVFCLVQSFLLFYSKVDPNYLLERLSRSKKWEELQLSMGINLNSSQEGTSLIQQANNNNGNNGGAGGSGNSISGGFQAITGGSNYSALAAAIESKQFDTKGSVSGGTEQTVRLFEGSFGTDYSRNPLYFLANGVLIITLVIAWLIAIITATTVKCKLSGQQENMSDKSQIEMAQFTNVLIVAHLPTILVAIAGINYIVCFVMGESNQPIQEFLGMLLIAPVPTIYAFVCLVFITEFRHATQQILLCRIWNRKQRQERAAAERKAQENIDEELASASRNKLRNKRMPNSESALPNSTEQTGGGENTKSVGTTSNNTKEKSGRYIDATDDTHREARALFGKQN
uniref:Uncharacterized protein n=3 Tax=Meloidogyne TaxID=189290 RepID=A0A6V7TU57_MELEN|nr:unnamed protein product [Meloidogyne enterolobii]